MILQKNIVCNSDWIEFNWLSMCTFKIGTCQWTQFWCERNDDTWRCTYWFPRLYVEHFCNRWDYLLSDFVVDIGSYKPEMNDMTVTKVIRKPLCDSNVNLILGIKSIAPNRTELTGRRFGLRSDWDNRFNSSKEIAVKRFAGHGV